MRMGHDWNAAMNIEDAVDGREDEFVSNQNQKIMIAGVGGSSGDRKCMMWTQGYVVPLAATEELRDLVEARGEDEVSEMLTDAGVDFPPAGGLWVLECGVTYDADDDDDQAWHARRPSWRRPTPEELDGLCARQMMRASGVQVEPPEHGGRWAFLGAMV